MGAWCIGSEMNDGTNADSGAILNTSPSTLLAVVSDQAQAPDGIINAWEVFDHDMGDFKTDTGLQIRCGVRPC